MPVIFPLILPLFVLFGMIVMYAVAGVVFAVKSASGYVIGRFGVRVFIALVGLILLLIAGGCLAWLISTLPPERRSEAIASIPAWLVSLVFGRDPNGRFELLRVAAVAAFLVTGFPLALRVYARQHGLAAPSLARVGFSALIVVLATGIVGVLPAGRMSQAITPIVGPGLARVCVAAVFGVVAWFLSVGMLPGVLERRQGWAREHARAGARKAGALLGVGLVLMMLFREWITVGMAAGAQIGLAGEAAYARWWLAISGGRGAAPRP